MKIALSSQPPTDVAADILAIGVRHGRAARDLGALDKAMDGALLRHIKDEDFEGKRGEVLKVPARGGVAASWVVLVGLGKDAPAPSDARLLAVKAAASARLQKRVAVVLPSADGAFVRQASEGLVMGSYQYTTYQTGPRRPKSAVREGTIVGVDPKLSTAKSELSAGQIVAEAINLARDLVNAPPNDLNPPALASIAKKECQKHGVTCTVWNKARIEKEKMNLLLAVNRGSAIEPRLVHMHYKPKAKAKAKVAFVGKGLTFDSGGLCIKPPKAMIDMKCDMAGAATTLGIVLSAARLKLPVEIHAVIGSTENMTGAHAYRPGDVFTSLDGKTVEIINTDAEGRLVLADCLAWTRKLKPDYLFTHATLTGACMVALGPWTAGLFATEDKLAKRYLDASKSAGESMWQMPLLEDLREGLRSDIADLKHTGEPHGGAISAALFLQEFVGDSTFAHLDIAGPAMLDRPHGVDPKGGTGFGIATAIRFLEGLSG